MCSAQDRWWRLVEARSVFSTGNRVEAGRGKGRVQHRIEGLFSAQETWWRLGEARGVKKASNVI